MSIKFQKEFSKFKDLTALEPIQYHALLGKTPTVVEHPTRKGYCYARMADNLSELITVFNDKVSQAYDLPVIIERRGLTWYVVGRDIQRYADWGTSSPFLPKHHTQHEFNRDTGSGADTVFIYPDQFMPLLVFPSGTSGAGNLQIAPYVLKRNSDFIYVGNTGTPNLLIYKPTDNTGIVGLVYLDTTTGNPGILVASGTPFVGSITGTSDLLPYVPYPTSTDQEPLYFFRLVSGTSSLGWNNLYNARQMIGGGVGSTGSSGSIPLQTAKRILISDASGNIGTSDYLAYDDTTRILTMGEAVGGFVQSVIWNLSSSISRVLNMITWGAGSSSRFKGTFARGSISAATAAQSGDTLVRFSGAGYDGVTSIQNAATSVELRFVSSELQSNSSHGTQIEFYTTPTGTTTLTKVMTLGNDGNVNIEAGKEYRINNVSIGGGTNSFQIDCSGGTSDTYGALVGTIDGTNKIFTVSLGRYVSGSLQLYLNGQLLTQGISEDWTETTPSSGTFTLTEAPILGDVLIAFYKQSAVSSGNADTLDGYEAVTLLNNPLIGRNVATVDFGTGLYEKTITIVNSLATSSSYIVANILNEATSNNTADDIMIQPLEIKIGARTAGSFDITVSSLINVFVGEVYITYALFN